MVIATFSKCYPFFLICFGRPHILFYKVFASLIKVLFNIKQMGKGGGKVKESIEKVEKRTEGETEKTMLLLSPNHLLSSSVTPDVSDRCRCLSGQDNAGIFSDACTLRISKLFSAHARCLLQKYPVLSELHS